MCAPRFPPATGWDALAYLSSFSVRLCVFRPVNYPKGKKVKNNVKFFSPFRTNQGKYGIHCLKNLERTLVNGKREARPSRMEVCFENFLISYFLTVMAASIYFFLIGFDLSNLLLSFFFLLLFVGSVCFAAETVRPFLFYEYSSSFHRRQHPGY